MSLADYKPRTTLGSKIIEARARLAAKGFEFLSLPELDAESREDRCENCGEPCEGIHCPACARYLARQEQLREETRHAQINSPGHPDFWAEWMKRPAVIDSRDPDWAHDNAEANRERAMDEARERGELEDGDESL